MARIFLYFIGIFYIVIGALAVFATSVIRKKFFNKLWNISDMKKLSPIPILVGILLLLAAPSNRYGFFVAILGILGIAKGVMIIIATEKMEKMKEWWVKADNNVYKIMGITIIILGSAILVGLK